MTDVAILGTGMVGRELARAIAGLGHRVVVGTRDPQALLARVEPDSRGLEPFAAWRDANATVAVASFSEAAAAGEVIFNAVAGVASLEALRTAGAAALAGKVLVDLANPLDFSAGMPPRLTIVNTDSLAEQIQRAFPETRVVKALNTVTAPVMVDPGKVGGGDHDAFICGNENAAKAEVTRILREWFGWRSVIDLGDITAARGLEMYVALWVRLMMSLGTTLFNVKVVR